MFSEICHQFRLAWWLAHATTKELLRNFETSNAVVCVRLFDNGLTADIDAKQYAYFASLADKLPADAKIVVVTHDPNWVLDNYEGAPQHRRYLDALLSRSTIKSKLRLRLAGDIHNYMRHTSKSGGPTLIVSGGGGAFLHPTHCAKLGREPLSYQGKTYEQNRAHSLNNTLSEMSRKLR